MKEKLIQFGLSFLAFLLAVGFWGFVMKKCESDTVSNGELKEYLMKDSKERKQENERMMNFVDSSLNEIKQIDHEIIEDSIAVHSASFGENLNWLHNYLDTK